MTSVGPKATDTDIAVAFDPTGRFKSWIDWVVACNQFISSRSLMLTLCMSTALISIPALVATTAESWITHPATLAIGSSLCFTFYYLLAKKPLHKASKLLLLTSLLLSLACTILLEPGSHSTGAILYTPVLVAGTLFKSRTILLSAIISLALSAVDTYLLLYSLDFNMALTGLTHLTPTYPLGILILATSVWLLARQRESAIELALAAKPKPRHHSAQQASPLDLKSLHKFAYIGQSTSVMLHELSNHLSVLNLDIYDLLSQHSNTELAASTKETLSQLNNLIHQTRERLVDTPASQVASSIKKSVEVAKLKHPNYYGRLGTNLSLPPVSIPINNDSGALVHILAVLLDNAIEACKNTPRARVYISARTRENYLAITVSDNGPGVPANQATSLFAPKPSQKPNGLGIGLFLAHQLATDHLSGSLYYTRTLNKSHFTLTIPISKNYKDRAYESLRLGRSAKKLPTALAYPPITS